jgi:ABC-type multidrug transport system permease subunit
MSEPVMEDMPDLYNPQAVMASSDPVIPIPNEDENVSKATPEINYNKYILVGLLLIVLIYFICIQK